MKILRKSLTNEEVFLKSEKIQKNLFSYLDKLSFKNVCTYISAFNEPDTKEIINSLLKKDKKICVPVTDTVSKTISLSLINDLKFKKGAYTINEPENIIHKDYNFPEIIIVPGIAFDRSKNRIGFGMGYYDKFLINSNGIKIGLCYDFQLLDNIPSNKHDIKMDVIITEESIIL